MIEHCGQTAPHEGHGDCPGYPGDGVMPTDAQWLGYLRAVNDDDALTVVASIREAAERGHDCFIRGHDAHIEHLSAKLVATAPDEERDPYEDVNISTAANPFGKSEVSET